MSDIGKAYVQIIPKADGISGSISSVLDKESGSAGKSAGINIAGAIKGAIAAAGIGTVIKSALDAGGNLQQSFGGLETLYGEAAEGAKKYAAEAAKAGISANDYAEQAVSFGASLKQAFGGDTKSAMESANTAILDMTDNAAKMGTPLESIQNAYQGFAKQNYTMLDNLKLGYGGTKSEMERLLADAQKLSGVEYNIENLGDVYSAIHVIQEDLGLTGVAAAEASETFSGSLGAMKAAGENLLANLALGEDIGPSLDALGTTVNNFLFKNLLPMIGNMLEAVPELLSGLSSMIIQSLNIVSNNSDEIVSQGIEIVSALVEAIIAAAPYLIEAAVNLVASLGEALINTDWITVGTDLMNSLRDSIDIAAGEILGTDTLTLESLIQGIMSGANDLLTTGGELILDLCDGITEALPDVLDTGVEILMNIVNGILENLPQLIETAGELLTQFTSFIMSNMPKVLSTGAELLLNLVTGILSNMPKIIESMIKVVGQLITTLGQNYPKILQQGIEIIGKLVAGLLQAIPYIIQAIPEIISAIIDTFARVDWASIGHDLISGIANGIRNAAGWIVDAARDAAQSAFEAACSWLGINSPAKKGIYIGEMLDKGFALGVEENMGIAEDAVEKLADASIDGLTISNSPALGAIPASPQAGDVIINMTINGAEGQDINELAALVEERISNSIMRRKMAYA